MTMFVYCSEIIYLYFLVPLSKHADSASPLPKLAFKKKNVTLGRFPLIFYKKKKKKKKEEVPPQRKLIRRRLPEIKPFCSLRSLLTRVCLKVVSISVGSHVSFGEFYFVDRI